MKPAVIHIACAVEGSYDVHSAVLLHSAASSVESSRLHVHYLHGPGYPSRSRTEICRMLDRLGAGISFHEIPPSRVAGLPVVGEFTPAMWYRIFLPDLVDAGRILYLDTDIVVADSIEPLWEIDLRGSYLGAVTNVFQWNHRNRPASLGLAGPDDYFNSGVLLMNLEEMRTGGTVAALHECAVLHGSKLAWPDQDALNLVFEGRWRKLHPRWNAMNSLRLPQAVDVFGAEAVAAARRHPGIRHFEGPGSNKPWHYGCDHDDRELYFEHRRGTPWPRWRLEGQPRSVRDSIESARQRMNWRKREPHR